MKVLLFIGITTLVTQVFGTVPSYIQVCGRRNPKFDQCVIESVAKLMPKLRNGIPELDVPAIEPMFIDHTTLTNLTNFLAIAHNMNVHGISHHNFTKFHMDFEKRNMQINAYFKEIKFNADYFFETKILVPFSAKGTIEMVLPDVKAEVMIQYDLVKRKAKVYLYLFKMTLDLTLNGYKATFNAREGSNDENVLGDAVNDILVNNQAEILQSIKPNIERKFSERILELGNKIVKHFTYDEIFPDRE